MVLEKILLYSFKSFYNYVNQRMRTCTNMYMYLSLENLCNEYMYKTRGMQHI